MRSMHAYAQYVVALQGRYP